MDVCAAVKKYVTQMVQSAGSGMKVLLMDRETTGMLSVVFSQSDILRHEVFLFERIDGGLARDTMKHLKCICFLRPTRDSIELLAQELRSPKYGSYYVYFSNVLSKADLKHLAESDDQEVVKEVQEFYADYFSLGRSLFSLNLASSYTCGGLEWRAESLTRSLQGIAAVLLSLKLMPLIRYQASSGLAKKLGEKVKQFLTKESALFDFRRPEIAPVLLIVDRREDPVSPMLNQWTYQAMVHELLTITNQRVSLAAVPNVPRELHEIVLSPEQDSFFAAQMYSNFGEIATNIKRVIDEYQAESQAQTRVETIADMKAFIINYPQFKKKSANVSKHVALIGELSRIMHERHLLAVSETEQEIVCGGVAHAECVQRLERLFNAASDDGRLSALDMMRLLLLYQLRFERQVDSRQFERWLQKLAQLGAPSWWLTVTTRIVQFCGTTRSPDLFPPDSTTTATGFIRRLAKGLREVENIYTQHEPRLKSTVEQLLRNRLRDAQYPYVSSGQPQQQQQQQARERPQNAIVFVVGGVTYEEVACISKINEQNPGFRVILGGTTVHNLTSFLGEISKGTE